MNVNESAENYLETIPMLSKKLPVVRSVDIANELGFKKSSVSIAMKNLREKNHITVTDAGFIYLTDSGKEIAEMMGISESTVATQLSLAVKFMREQLMKHYDKVIALLIAFFVDEM